MIDFSFSLRVKFFNNWFDYDLNMQPAAWSQSGCPAATQSDTLWHWQRQSRVTAG